MDNNVICKMKCARTGADENNTHSVQMYPVIGGSEENDKFFKYTPGGDLKLCVMGKQHFTPGKFYYITIQEIND